MKKKVLMLMLTALIVLLSCNSNKNTAGDIIYKGKNIVFPKNTYVLRNRYTVKNNEHFLDSISHKYKILSIVDATCASCIIDRMNYLDSLFNTIIHYDNTEIIFVLNVNKKDSSNFMRNLYDLIQINGNLLWDTNFNFERENKLFSDDKNHRTFLINSSNKVELYGDPLINQQILQEYEDIILNNM